MFCLYSKVMWGKNRQAEKREEREKDTKEGINKEAETVNSKAAKNQGAERHKQLYLSLSI